MAFLNYSAEELLNDPVLMQEFVNNVQQSIEEAAGEGGGEGDTYSLEGAVTGNTVTYTLDAESGTDSSIGFTAGTGMSFTYNTNTQTITLNATGSDSEGNYLTVDTTTGEIKEGENTFQYLYRYLHVRFSANSNGSGFVTDPASVSGSSIYIGLANRSTITAPTEASDYSWTEYTWSSVHNVFYRKTGGNRIELLTSSQSSVGTAVEFTDGDSPLDFNVLEINTGNIVNAAITTTKISNNAITTPLINAGAITTEKIEAGAVDAGKIEAGAVTTDKLDANAVTAGKIAADAVTAAKIDVDTLSAIQADLGDVTAGTLKGGSIPDANTAPSGTEKGSFFDLSAGKFVVGDATNNLLFDGTDLVLSGEIINTSNLVDYAITAAKIGDSEILAAAIANDAVTTAKILDGSITGVKIMDSEVTAAKINTGAVTTNKLDANAVTADKINAGAITAGKLDATSAVITQSIQVGNNVIDTDSIQTNAISTDKIQSNAISADKIQAKSIDAVKIDVNALSAISANMGEIVAGSIRADLITSGFLDAERLSTSTAYITDNAMVGNGVIIGANLMDSEIGSTKIAGGAITSSAIATGAVTADAINVSNLAAISANMGTITAGSMSADLITAGTLSADRLALDGQYITTNADGELILSDEAVDTDKLKDAAVTNTKIGIGAVDSDSIALNSIAAKNIAAGAITADAIAAGTITGDKIDATTVISRTVQSSNYDPRNPIDGDGPADAGYSLEAGNGIIYAEEVHADLTGTVTAPSPSSVSSGSRKYFSTAATRKFVDTDAGATLKTYSSPNGTYTAKYYVGEPIWVLDLEDSDLTTSASSASSEVDGVNADTGLIEILNTLDCYVTIDNIDTDQFTSNDALADAGLILEAYDADDEFYAVATEPFISSITGEDIWNIDVVNTSNRIWLNSDGSFRLSSDIDSTGVSFVIETSSFPVWRFYFDSTASDFVVNDIKKLKVYLGVVFGDRENPDGRDPADFVTALPFDLEMGTLQDSQVEIEVPVTGAGKNITITQESGL